LVRTRAELQLKDSLAWHFPAQQQQQQQWLKHPELALASTAKQQQPWLKHPDLVLANDGQRAACCVAA
jgi:hypothetical protein